MALIVAASVVAVQPVATGSAVETQAPSGSSQVRQDHPVLTRHGWRHVLDFYRKTANLPPLAVRDDWSDAARAHARYMVRNRVIGHDESPSKPGYSAAGRRAAQNGNLSLGLDMTEPLSARLVIERWMAAPFHGAAIIDPKLRTTGFGVYRERKNGYVAQGTVLDVASGRTGSSGNKVVVWPGQGMQVPINTYSGNERPDPSASCDGYSGEIGLPLIANFPTHVRIASTSLSGSSGSLEHCSFDEHTYRNPNKDDQQWARSVLAQRNTVVIVPRLRLRDFDTFTATIRTTAGQTVRWSFSIGEVEPPYDARIIGAPASRAFQDRTTFGVAWTATDEESGAARFDIRWRRSSLTGSYGPHRTWLSGATGRSEDFDAEPGYTYCFSARATDRGGNRSGWGKETCTTTPVRSMDLHEDPLWVPLIGNEFYAGRASLSMSQGSFLRTGVVKATRLALIATSHPGAGTVDVLWNGSRLKRVNLEGTTFRSRRQIELTPFQRTQTGRVTVRVVSGDHVIVEGIGISRL